MNSYFSMYRESLQNFLSVWQYDSTRWWLPCMLTAFSFKVYKLSVFIKELEIRQSVNIAYCKKLFSKNALIKVQQCLKSGRVFLK